jgi:hypothetical protein
MQDFWCFHLGHSHPPTSSLLKSSWILEGVDSTEFEGLTEQESEQDIDTRTGFKERERDDERGGYKAKGWLVSHTENDSRGDGSPGQDGNLI